MPKNNAPLQIRLTEPVIFLKGPSTGLDFRGRPQAVRQDGQPAIVRGLLTLRLSKPTRIRSIAIKLEGKARTEWPEGIGQKRMDTSEEHVILFDQTTFFSAYHHDDSRSTSARRARSVGPGVIGGGHDEEDVDDEAGVAGGRRGYDASDDWLSMGRSRSAIPGRQEMVRSSSAMPGTHDNHTWHRDGFSRRPSFDNTTFTPPDLSGLSVQDRGPSPAYTPHASPPRNPISLPGGQPSRPSSLRQSSTNHVSSRDHLPSREPALSPIASVAPSAAASQSASERGDSAEATQRRHMHPARGLSFADAVQEGAEWTPAAPSPGADASPEDPTGVRSQLQSILENGQRGSQLSAGEVRFREPTSEQQDEEKHQSTDRRESVQEDESPEQHSAPEAPSVPANNETDRLADPSVSPSTTATPAPTTGNRAASVRTFNSAHSASSVSLAAEVGDGTSENHPVGADVQAISVANTAYNSPAPSAPPSIRQRSSTETLSQLGRGGSTTDTSSPSASRRTSLNINSTARRPSEQNVADAAARTSQENTTRQGRTTRLGSTSTIVESPPIMTNGSQPHLPSSLRGSSRPARQSSGTPSIASGSTQPHNRDLLHLRSGSNTPRDPSEDSRGRKSSKFSLAATLRGISREVKESFHHHGRASSKSRSRMSSPVRGASDGYMSHSERPTASISSSSQSVLPRSGSATNMHDTVRRSASRNPSYVADDFQPSFGRGGAGSRPSRSRERGSSAIRVAEGDERSRSRARGRHKGMKVLTDKLGIGEHEESQGDDVHNWKEFRKGTYNYPISFPIPVTAPPTIHAEFGSVTYRLKATVVRVGALTSNLTEDMEITMIAQPQEDDMEESENVIVERQWEEQMRYQITLGGKAFPISGTIPISIRLMPLLKCKIHRITVALEEKTDYFAQERKVARHETPKRFVLLFIKQPDQKERIEPLLPIISDDPNAAEQSPVAEMARQAVLNNPLSTDLFDLERDPNDSMYASLMEPTGPWHLEKDLHVPDCASKIKFTSKHEQTNIAIGHFLKVTIRVERGDDVALDTKGRRKQFDIIIETPIKILDCRVNPQWNSLPTYSVHSRNITAAPGICSIHGNKGSAPLVPKNNGAMDASIAAAATPPRSPGDLPASAGGNAEAGPSSYFHAHPSRRGTTDTLAPGSAAGSPGSGPLPPSVREAGEDSLLERNIVYDRLMSGQVTVTGEVPPTYGEALADAARTRSASRVRDAPAQNPYEDSGVSMSRGRSEISSRGRSRLRE
ncbi:hypothetical protein IAU60_005214 [Kwoniella sp. DSM 27419]